MRTKAQISIEYLILTGFILLIIVVPAAIFLSSMANKTVYGSLNTQRATDLGNGIVDNAKQMYYLGLYSKKIVDYYVPENVKKLFIVDLMETLPSGAVKEYYYFGIIVYDSKEMSRNFFPSTIPLMSDITSSYVEFIDSTSGSAYTDISSYVPECSSPSMSCSFYSFIAPVTREGKKSFKIETRYDGNEVKASIIPLIS
jgi:hypothetical protein